MFLHHQVPGLLVSHCHPLIDGKCGWKNCQNYHQPAVDKEPDLRSQFPDWSLPHHKHQSPWGSGAASYSGKCGVIDLIISAQRPVQILSGLMEAPSIAHLWTPGNC